jgi:serine-type D-Ala-D-Ala carboxypeptidase/endopeptidase (penicillin-binding protein 4)
VLRTVQAGPGVRTGGRAAAVPAALLLVAGLVAGSSVVAAPGARPGSGALARPAPTTPTPTAPAAPAPVLEPHHGAGQAPTAAGIARALARPLADPALGGRLSGRIVDLGSGAVLLDRNGGRPVTPASTAKLATAIAVLAVRAPEERLRTRVVAGARPGEVVLVGAGDPTLTAARRGAAPTYQGAARLADLAAAARRAGVTSVTRVVVDGSAYTGPRTAPGWEPSDISGGHVAPITALMVDGGRAKPRFRARSAEPDVAAGRALAAQLGAPNAAVVRGQAPAGAAVLGEVRSAPVGRIVEQMLLASDNVLAEALARLVAVREGLAASFAGAAEAVRRVLDRLGVPLAAARLRDGSGLSRLDRLAPATLTALLRTAVAGDRPQLAGVVAGLPVAGYDGTLGDRFLAGSTARAAAGMVRAKTGTLSGVSSLAGVVADAGGRLLGFAFVADRVSPVGTLAAEAALDRLAATLARCGCP